MPTDYYTVSTVNYGPIIAVIITMERQLSTYRYTDGTNQGWSNEIYVTFESSVGPNTVDIMKYLIDTYTTLAYDNDSFNYCAEKLAAFPSNFALLETKNIIDVLRDIAFQCRCAIWISDDVFYMKYLPEEPTLPNFTFARRRGDRSYDLGQRSELDGRAAGLRGHYGPGHDSRSTPTA